MAMTGEEIHDWLNNAGLLPEHNRDASFANLLKDGISLCRLINRIKPGSVTNVTFQTRKLCVVYVHHSRLARDIYRKMLNRTLRSLYKHVRAWEYKR